MISSVFTWLATIVALTGTFLNCRKIKACFYLWTVTNTMWLVYDVSCGLASRAILDAVQLVLAIYGIYEWSKDDERRGGGAEVEDPRGEQGAVEEQVA